ncbi:sarcosine dehydrogenase, mitochondrial-like [Panulirus ornatus]|uniref:sarcosine dehydrogenase, mitochondrial-like n=1 Tax=Panulirus ornatus TaxID=150431 RepID=UPI003A89C8D8
MASILVRRKVLDAGRRLHGVVALRAVSGATGVPNKTNIKEKDVSGVASIPSEADVVVIGGGIVGCSALYHLAKLGVTNAILLEAHKLTAGTTWHTAGLMHLLNWSETDFLLKNITYKLLLGLQEETGVDPGWNSNGSMYIASKKVAPLGSKEEEFFFLCFAL